MWKMPASEILAKSYPSAYENQMLTTKMSDINLWTTEKYLNLSIYLDKKKTPNGSDLTSHHRHKYNFLNCLQSRFKIPTTALRVVLMTSSDRNWKWKHAVCFARNS